MEEKKTKIKINYQVCAVLEHSVHIAAAAKFMYGD